MALRRDSLRLCPRTVPFFRLTLNHVCVCVCVSVYYYVCNSTTQRELFNTSLSTKKTRTRLQWVVPFFFFFFSFFLFDFLSFFFFLSFLLPLRIRGLPSGCVEAAEANAGAAEDARRTERSHRWPVRSRSRTGSPPGNTVDGRRPPLPFPPVRILLFFHNDI